MIKIGIIVEYNPFHNGHLYHINKIKEMYPDSLIIAVMSGNFTQHGEVSIINKWDKTEIALNYGVDLVVELPFVFATQSADIFAKASIDILSALGVDKIVFGSESNNVSLLNELAHIQLNNNKYDKLVLDYMSEGFNYPTASSKALFYLTGKKISESNDILALAYVREVIKHGDNIECISIKRNNDFNSVELNDNMTSATSIRYALKNGDNVDNYVPEFTLSKLNNLCFTDDLFSLLKYKILTDKDLSIYQTVDEGIENRLVKYVTSSRNMNEFLLKVKNKRYTYSKLMRMFIHILVGFTKEEAKNCKSVTYIRILGFNFKGREYLNNIKNEISIPLLSRFASTSDNISSLEYRSTCLYAYLFDNEKSVKIIESEYKNTPIMY